MTGSLLEVARVRPWACPRRGTGWTGFRCVRSPPRAQVSRHTLYRYFRGREAILECMGEQVRRRWEVVLRSIMCMSEVVPETKAIFDNAPGFALAYLQRGASPTSCRRSSRPWRRYWMVRSRCGQACSTSVKSRKRSCVWE